LLNYLFKEVLLRVGWNFLGGYHATLLTLRGKKLFFKKGLWLEKGGV